MEEISSELLPVLQLLMPGFLTTMTFYWFAEVIKPNQFERVLQALVCTPIIQLLLIPTEQIAYKLGDIFQLGYWTSESQTYASIGLALVIGIILAFLCNKDIIYRLARLCHITTKSAQGDQIDHFKRSGKTPTLFHFKDGRCVSGYMLNFPTYSSPNTFFIKDPEWIGKDGEPQPNPECDRMLIYTADISSIDFTKEDDE